MNHHGHDRHVARALNALNGCIFEMNKSKILWIAAIIGLASMTEVIDIRAADREGERRGQGQGPGQAQPGRRTVRPAQPGGPEARPGRIEPPARIPENDGGRVGVPNTRPDGVPSAVRPAPRATGDAEAIPRNAGVNDPRTGPRAPLTEISKPNGGIERRSPSGMIRSSTTVDQKTGIRQTQQIAPTGRVETREIQKPDGTRQVTRYDLGRERRTEIVRPDKTVATTDVHYNRFGTERARETVVRDTSGRPVSRTVAVRQNLVIRNTTIVQNRFIVRNYSPCRWGYVYRPIYIAPVVFASWYDPFWYTPFGAPIYHPFHYAWGWEVDPWYRYHAYYWEPYPVYAAPSYWVTDWMVAGYMADRYAVAVSAEQTREEVRLAREDAEKARVAAEQARDAAEVAEARAAQAEAEARAERAEARAAKAEIDEAKRKEMAGKPNPNAKPIDKETKEALKNQVEKTIAEKKALADQAAKGGSPVPPDVTAALADPQHIYPVSKNLSVTRAEDSKPAGTLTAGDLLKLEPGQEKALKDATENTPINMRVITSKGESDSVPAGTVVAVPLKELQEFDNEFKAKLDLGLIEAEKNKQLFKKGAQK
jgi:hypothetical protein